MSKGTRFDSWVTAYARWVIRWRVPVIIASLGLAVAAASGGRFIGFSTDYRVFFSDENPQLEAFEALQNVYTKNDNILFVVEPEDGNAFSAATLSAVEELTAEAWKIPFAIRVDAVTNFQHTRAEEDDLVVEDLVRNAELLTEAELAERQAIALAEPIVRNRLLPDEAHVTGVNVTMQFPGEAIDETTRSVAAARELAARIEAEHPGITTYLTGMTMLSNAFMEASQRDMGTLMPLMFLVLIVVIGILLRSVTGTVVTVVIIGLSVATAMGLAGFAGLQLTPVSASAPVMILTLAVADSIHILVTMLRGMRSGLGKHDALVESLRVNMQPVFLTSLTTVIGFLSMNFSDAPPFHHLGNTTAVGVGAAYVYSVLLLPALIAVLPVRARIREARHEWSDRLGDFVVRYRQPLLWTTSVAVIVFGAFVPRNDLNDQFVQYFDDSVEFRTDTDFTTQNLTGVYQLHFSLGAGESGGISNPEYLAKLDEFAEWYRAQPNVVHVSSLAETIKRLNKNLHGDDEAYYRITESRELAAQYLLLYEMSLPYGLDLNNQINVDKSATRLVVTLEDLSTREIREITADGETWLRQNAPSYMHTHGAGATTMFAHISARNINGMIRGTIVAFILVSAALFLALRSLKIGFLSLIPNLVPAALAFGVWGAVVGQVNVGVSVVIAMAFGIVVDDTVHFLSKYVRAKREQGMDAQEAVRYAFTSVGPALVVTSIIIAAGFLVLALSSFDMNASMGKLTAVTVVFALVADFFLLAPLLMAVEERETATIREPSLKSETDEHALLPA
jgi:predicted RND superfamily exporter protein